MVLALGLKKKIKREERKERMKEGRREGGRKEERKKKDLFIKDIFGNSYYPIQSL
jgi:hypothetical protein